jgi:S1-C subfamily serine protease
MGRARFARGSRGLAATLSVLSIPVLLALGTAASVGCGSNALAADGLGTATAASDVQAVSTLELTGLQNQFSTVADKAAPTVVAISASCTPIDSDDALRSENLNPQKLDSILSKTTRTVGTGFFIDSDGYILTNEHVVCEAEQLWVTTDERKVYPAIVIGSDPRADLAILKVPVSGVPVAKLATPSPIHRGQWTIAIGNPYGMAAEGEMAMSVGVVSATERSLPKLSNKEGRLYSNLIQTTAEINPGNSGGPLFNLAGEVIGINTAVILPQKQTNGIGFAIPITNQMLEEVEQLKAGKEIVYGYLGVTVSDPTLHDRNISGAKDGGAIVESIEAKGPADGSKLKADDVITAVNGAAIRDSDSFIRIVGRAPIDQEAKLTIYRDKKSMELSVTPRRRPMPAVAINRETQKFRWRGITLTAVPANWAAKEGVYIVAIEDSAIAKKLGVKQGQVITSIAGKTIKGLADLQKLIDSMPLAEDVKFQTADGAAIATAQQ